MIRKVFIGCTDIASLIGDFCAGFHALGIPTFTVVYEQADVQGSRCDVVVARDARPTGPHESVPQARARLMGAVWEKAVAECDLFVFLWDSLRPAFADLAELRARGKRIVWWFLGSDARWKGAFDQDMARFGLAPLAYEEEAVSLPERLLRVRLAERYADAVFNTPSQAGLALRPYFNALRYPIALEALPHAPVQRARPVVVHAPSSKDRKRTAEISAVLDTLAAEGLDFEIRMLPRMSHADALAAYADTDVLVGQLYGVTLGKQDRELMAMGKVVVGGVRPSDYPQAWPADCPAVPAHTPSDLLNVLRGLLPDLAKRQAAASAGREYIAREHDPAAVAAHLLAVCSDEPPAPDFRPHFFRFRFEPEPALLGLYNDATSLVQDTPWYRRAVAEGARAGLRF